MSLRGHPALVYPPEVRRLAVELVRSGKGDGEVRREVYRLTGYTVGSGTATKWARESE